MDKVTVDSALEHCCSLINERSIQGRLRSARAANSGVSVEYELHGFSVSVHVDLVYVRVDSERQLLGKTKISCNATQLTVTAAQEFIALYAQVAQVAQAVQSYLDSVVLVVD